MTLGDVIRIYRNKFLTHQTFDPNAIDGPIHANFDLDNPQNQQRLGYLVHQLFMKTNELYVDLAMRYPLARRA